jgi:hypothetical protein
MIDVLIAAYLGAVVAWVLQDHAGISFLMANMFAAPVTVGAWRALAWTESDV